MKKLKTKTFITLCTIFSLFLISLLFMTNYQTYNKEQENIKRNLTRLNTITTSEKLSELPLKNQII